MRAVFVFGFLILTMQALAAPSLPPFAWKPGAVGIVLNSEYFMSDANYEDSRGSFRRLASGNSITAFENTLQANYALSGKWYPYVGMGFGMTRTLEPTVEKSNSIVNRVSLGSYTLLGSKWMRIIGEGAFSLPLEKSNGTQSTPLTSDATSFITFKIHLLKPLRSANLFATVGLNWPLDGLSKKLLYGIGGEKPFGKNFSAGVAINGYETIKGDTSTSTQRSQLHSSAMAGSSRFQTFDPALIESGLWIGFSPQRSYRVRIGYSRTLNGIRAAEGQALFVQINLNWNRSVTETESYNFDDISQEATQTLREEEAIKRGRTDGEVDIPRRPPPPANKRGEDPLDATEKTLDGPETESY